MLDAKENEMSRLQTALQNSEKQLKIQTQVLLKASLKLFLYHIQINMISACFTRYNFSSVVLLIFAASAPGFLSVSSSPALP